MEQFNNEQNHIAYLSKNEKCNLPKTKLPSMRIIKKSHGDLNKLSLINKVSLQVQIKNTKNLPEPIPGQWLYVHREKGQSFDKFATNRRKVDKKNKQIYILPLVYDMQQNFIQELGNFASVFFLGFLSINKQSLKGMNIGFFKKLPDFKSWKIKKINKDGVNCFNGGKILDKLIEIKPCDAYCVLGITNQDIYHRKNHTLVCGVASGMEKIGVISIASIQKQHKDIANIKEILFYKSCRVMCHEISHSFGLKHCIFNRCLMQGSNNQDEDKPFQLCPVCLRKLQSALNFNIYERYIKLKEISSQIGGEYFTKEAQIYDQIIQQIKQKIQSDNDTIKSTINSSKKSHRPIKQ